MFVFHFSFFFWGGVWDQTWTDISVSQCKKVYDHMIYAWKEETKNRVSKTWFVFDDILH